MCCVKRMEWISLFVKYVSITRTQWLAQSFISLQNCTRLPWREVSRSWERVNTLLSSENKHTAMALLMSMYRVFPTKNNNNKPHNYTAFNTTTRKALACHIHVLFAMWLLWNDNHSHQRIPTRSPSSSSPGGDVMVHVPDINQPSLPTPFTLFLRLFLSYCPFTCISFHEFSWQLSVFSLCSPSHISASLVLSTIYIFLKVSLNGFGDPARLPCAATRVGGGRDPGDWGTHWLRPVGVNTSLWPGLLLDGWLGWPDPINRLVVFSPNFGIRRQRLESIGR